MEIDEIIVIISGIAGIIFTYWFSLMKNSKEVAVADGLIDITVDGGYQPEFISIPKGQTTKISFIRKDSSSCLQEVVIPEFRVKKYLPMNKKVTIEINPKKKGEFIFSCSMNMNHGKIKVV